MDIIYLIQIIIAWVRGCIHGFKMGWAHANKVADEVFGK